MASTTTMTEAHIENALTNIRAMLTDLPELVQEQAAGTLSESERISWSLDWDQAMVADLWLLTHADQAHRLTQEQQNRYRDLRQQLRASMDLIHRFGLMEPPVPLDEAA